MTGVNHQGYLWATAAGLSAALAAVSAKLFSSMVKPLNFSSLLPYSASLQFLLSLHNYRYGLSVGCATQLRLLWPITLYQFFNFVKYGLILLFNVTMWGCYVNSLKALSSLQATVTNFSTNFLSSGLAGFFLFQESLPFRWFAGALFIIIGVFILSKSNIEKRPIQD